MMNSMKNKVQLMGHLGADPEVKTTAGGSKYARMRLATNEVYVNKGGEKVTDTTWHQLVAWDKQADIAAQYLRKGSEVLLEGRLSNRQWEDSKGEKHYVTEVVVNALVLLDKKAAVA